MIVNEILEAKGRKVWTVLSGQSIKEVLDVLVGNGIGSVVVIDRQEYVVGILSERDILRQCYKDPKNWSSSKVSEVMTPHVITVNPQDDHDYVMNLMTDNRIRHLPVLEGDKLVGIISIGDVVKSRLKKTEDENKYMKEYLSGS